MSYLTDSRVSTVLGVQENPATPKAVHDFLARDEVGILFHQEDEQFHGEPFQLDRFPPTAQLITPWIQFEFSELECWKRHF